MRKTPAIQRATYSLLAILMTMSSTLSPIRVNAATYPTPDTRWSNGWYESSFGDMAARQLYVYGYIESESKVTEKSTSADLFFTTDRQASRLDAAKLLYSIAGKKTDESSPFMDVPEQYTEAVSWLYAAGVTKGVSGSRYGTGDITEQQFLTMLTRLLAHQGKATNVEALSLPYYHSGEGFSIGDMYQITCQFLEKHLPDKRIVVRPRMSTPSKMLLYPNTVEDAKFQIVAAMTYLPTFYECYFPANTSTAELERLMASLDEETGDMLPVLISATDSMLIMPWKTKALTANAVELYIYGYSQAQIAYASHPDWIRVYHSEDYAEQLRSFREEHLTPLENKTDYERAKAAHDLLCRLASYDYTTGNYRPGNNMSFRGEAHDILGFIQDRSIVCDGYANTYSWMMTCLGVHCYMVLGQADGISHAWNKAMIDGNWYNVDACWSDTSSISYLLKSDKWLSSHRHTLTDDYSTTTFASTKDYG